MDKYTVDLDKVLNDFEYSELTDNFAANYAPQSGSTYASSSKSKSGDAKHSITNVFHSLNEYLNTDISVKQNVNYDNKVTSSPNEDALNCDNNESDSSFRNGVDSPNAEPNFEIVNKSADPPVGELIRVNNSTDDAANTNEDDRLIESKNVIENVDLLGDGVMSPSIDLRANIAVDQNEGSICDNSVELNENNAQNSDLGSKTNDVVVIEEDVDENSSKEAVDEAAKVKAVGFDDFELNDSELNRYLDDLEHEMESQSAVAHVEQVENVEEVLALNVSGTSPFTVELDLVPREEIQVRVEDADSVERPTSLELNAECAEVPLKREINLIGNPGSTPFNNVYISEQLVAENEESSNDVTDSSASPTFSEISTDAVTDSTDTESEHGDSGRDKSENYESNNNKVLRDRETGTEGCDRDSEASDAVSVTDACDRGEATTADAQSAEDDNLVDVENSDRAPQVTANDTCAPIESLVQSNRDAQDIAFCLGKQAPLWIPDSKALSCLHCDMRFTVIKRRHHCRACGLVLCSKCCNLKYKLEYLDTEARVCSKCYLILNRETNSSSGSEVSPLPGNSPSHGVNQPNPNNPMEYCSVVPPLQQVASGTSQNPPTVMVPVGVLKRKGSNKAKSNKSVMFCDGIRPGSDLTTLDTDFDYSTLKPIATNSNSKKPPAQAAPGSNRNLPVVDPTTKSFIPNDENSLPPTVTVFKSDITYTDCSNGEDIVETMRKEKVTFALQRNLHVHLKIVNMDCCINKQAWCFSTEGLISVGQDEVVYLIETVDGEKCVPVDVFHHINAVYNDAVKGTTVTELGISLHSSSNFLDFKNHAGFLYIRPTFQCLQNIIRPTEPFLIGILIHRWETPWAKIFPLRLVLRLGAEYRYYPSPIISTRHRDSVFVEIGHTIINLLADFRNFSYSLPSIRGLTIHMEDKNTTVTIPVNRYDQVMKSLNNSSDHILAFGGNFSTNADSHLVCIQDTQGNNENAYTTHAININNKPRKVTGASFIVFNGALKSTSGLTAKSSIVEDGLMIQIPAEHMLQVRESLKNMKDHTIQCGCVNAPSDETVNVVWGEPDSNFNMGVTSPIDNQTLSGVPSIRVHNGKDFVCNSGNRLIRWTEVFILQNTDETSKSQDPVDISKIAQSISKATCQALVKYLDLLTSNNFYKISIRTTLHIENVSYSAGSNNVKLPPIYMKNLDNELIPVLHRITSNNLGDNAIVLELIFRILNT